MRSLNIAISTRQTKACNLPTKARQNLLKLGKERFTWVQCNAEDDDALSTTQAHSRCRVYLKVQ